MLHRSQSREFLNVIIWSFPFDFLSLVLLILKFQIKIKYIQYKLLLNIIDMDDFHFCQRNILTQSHYFYSNCTFVCFLQHSENEWLLEQRSFQCQAGTDTACRMNLWRHPVTDWRSHTEGGSRANCWILTLSFMKPGRHYCWQELAHLQIKRISENI